MNTITVIAPVVVFLAAVFTIILVVMTKILRDARVFGPKTSVVLAFSITTVCIVGLWQFLSICVVQSTPTSTGSTGAAFKFFLFLCAILGSATLPLIAICIGKIPPREAQERIEPVKKATKSAKPTTNKKEQSPAKTKRGRPSKKEKPIEEVETSYY